MESIQYLSDYTGKKIAIQIDLSHRKRLTQEEIEEIEDIVSYELFKDTSSIDYNSEFINIAHRKESYNNI